MGLLGPADTCRFGSSAATVVAVAEPAGLEEVAPGGDRKQKGGFGHLVDGIPNLVTGCAGLSGSTTALPGKNGAGTWVAQYRPAKTAVTRRRRYPGARASTPATG